MANIHFIRAAILDATGQELTLEETRDILVEEGLLTPIQAKKIIFRGYAEFYEDYETKIEEEKVLDLVEMVNTTNM